MEKNKIILKILLIIIVIAVLIVMGNLLRKANVVSKFIERNNNIYNSSNVYAKLESGTLIDEYYIKEDRIVEKITSIEDGEEFKTTYFYSDGEEYQYVVIEDSNGKTVTKTDDLHKKTINTNILGLQDNDNFVELIKEAFKVKVTIEDCNGIECFVIKDKNDIQIYINKEDYTTVKVINGDSNISYTFKLDIVTDEDVKIPNFSGENIIDKTE